MNVAPSATMDQLGNGVIRGSTEGRGEPHLLPFAALRVILSLCYSGFKDSPWAAVIELSKLYSAGTKKYPPRNWEKGMPLHRFVDSTIRHLRLHHAGDKEEPHLVQVAWNLCGLLQTHLWIADRTLPPDGLVEGLPNVVIRHETVQTNLLLHGRDTDFYLQQAFNSLCEYVVGKGVSNLIDACACALKAVEIETT